MSIIDIPLPSEIWDHIAQYLSEPEDLLRLALVNSHLRDIVIPNHLNYTKIWTDNCNVALWKGLNAKNARRVRELRVDCVPGGMYANGPAWVATVMRDLESRTVLSYCMRRDVSQVIDKRCLCFNCATSRHSRWMLPMRNAISLMTGLRKLVVSFTPCHSDSISSVELFQSFGADLDDLEIHILPCLGYGLAAEDEDEDDGGMLTAAVETLIEAIWNLRGGYSRFSFQWEVEWEPDEISTVLDNVAHFLHKKCRNLRTLEIRAARDDMDRGFEGYQCSKLVKASWPDLRTLILHGVFLYPVTDEEDEEEGIDWEDDEEQALTNFLDEHRCLESLRVTGAPLRYHDELMDDALPELRLLQLDRYNLDTFKDFFCSVDSYNRADGKRSSRSRPLETLIMEFEDNQAGVSLSLIAVVDTICVHGSKWGTIRRLECSFPTYMDEDPYWLRLIGQCNPGITELRTQPRTQPEKDGFSSMLDNWKAILEWFPNLQVLHSQDAFWLSSSFTSEAKRLQYYQKKLPALRQVEGWVKQSECRWRNKVTKEEAEIEVQ